MVNIYYVAGIPYSNELYHHGIKGQRWGVRRFQNADGTRTEAGKKRYYSNDTVQAKASMKSALKEHKKAVRDRNRKASIPAFTSKQKSRLQEANLKVSEKQNQLEKSKFSYLNNMIANNDGTKRQINKAKKQIQKMYSKKYGDLDQYSKRLGIQVEPAFDEYGGLLGLNTKSAYDSRNMSIFFDMDSDLTRVYDRYGNRLAERK